jgi:hypothetical protein
VKYDNWTILFEIKNAEVELGLRNSTTEENRPIGQVLRSFEPEYAINLDDNLFDTIMTKSYVYINGLDYINNMLDQMTIEQCKQFKVTRINGIGPLWLGLILKKKSIWYKELNAVVTHRMTRFIAEANERK